MQSKTLKYIESNMPTFGGISLPEIAVLAAAGFVVWKNRAKISNFLEDNGVGAPSFLNYDLAEIIQSGASLIDTKSPKGKKTAYQASGRHDA